MPLRRRPLASLAACALAAMPALALGEVAVARPDGRLGYALSGGASVVSGTTLAAANVHFGGEAALATVDSQWRLRCQALWSRTVAETKAENVTVLLVQESRHHWTGRAWFWERLSLFPAMRSGENARGSVDTGLAIALTPMTHFSVGVTQRYDGNAATNRGDTRFVTGIAMKIH